MFKRKKTVLPVEELIRYNMLAGLYVRYLAQAQEFQNEPTEVKKSRALIWMQEQGLSWELASIAIEAAVYDMKRQ